MEKQKLLSILIGLVIGFGFGLGAGNFLSVQNSAEVTIISIDDNQEVHSVIVIDAIFDKGDEVKVFVNGTEMSNYLPYYWNNIEYPVGEYEISVGVKKNDNWSYDNITVIIPEEFIVPYDYEFTEDFVVHEGQTVYMTGNFTVGERKIDNGVNNVNGITLYDMNVFGTLIITNSTFTCEEFMIHKNGIVNITDSHIYIPFKYQSLDGREYRNTIFCQDNSILNLKNVEFNTDTVYFYPVSFENATINEL